MAEDGEVLRQMWDSYLPVSFHLSSNDLSSMKNPEPYYSMVPRFTYFSLIVDKIVVYFSQFIDSSAKSASNLWLDFLGTPLKFNYPIGLLYDLYAADIELPWSITVNFDRFPSDVLVRCNTRASMESTYLSSLKEADTLKHRNPVVSSMQKKDHNQLWNGLLNYKYEQFWSINRRLMSPDTDQTHFRHIPFRFYLTNSSSGCGCGCGDSDTPVFVQRLVKPTLEGGEQAQFGDLIRQVLGSDALEKKRFIIHGIEIPFDTPLQWMSEHLSYLDNFLHISVTDKS